MKIEQQIIVDASADKAWEILGHKYDRVSEWASSILESSGKHILPSDIQAPFSGRKCKTTLGSFDEQIISYDEQKMMLAYTAKGDKMPFFVKQMANNWSVTSLGKNRAQIDMRMEIDILPVFSLIMSPIMKMQMVKVTGEVIEDLKHFVETDRPHPRKAEILTEDRSRISSI